MEELPVIDLAPVLAGDDPAAIAAVADQVDLACRRLGFFCLVGHGIAPELLARLDGLARQLFALPEQDKASVAMVNGGRAWRGWFPLGGELTSGVADAKEGFYLGEELGPDDPRVRAGLPLHGPNLFPARPVGLRDAVLEYLDAATAAGQAVLASMAQGMGLDPRWFADGLTARPTVLLRLFHYPPIDDDQGWSVGEHTDYGLVTLLAQDDVGGLEVHGPDGWIEVPPVPGALVVNLGDMLERMTGGRYRSTPHRVRNVSGRDRVSMPLFLDPGWDERVRPVPGVVGSDPGRDERLRWDGEDPHAWEGTYGDYLTSRVARVFPDLFAAVGGEPGGPLRDGPAPA